MYISGEARANSVDTPYCKISNDRINIDKFICLSTAISEDFNTNKIKILLAIDKINCDAYLLGEWMDIEFYTILRFKNIELGIRYFNKLKRTDGKNTLNLCASAVNILRGDTGYVGDFNKILLCRKEVMKGVPNNYPFFSANEALLNILAKQPKI